ncbi:MAG: tRNA (adenosine(37)-N6)-threonylcarbamoyltransferase complex ATPase subunit type 1 TsaE [Alphaproteobacteria bacterium]|nr:tRNA (adenosine(37)-N6)-threonylcarbamoyltransferase complex ATPase subunit type 1 TsaE [Alphaproteobacteria bacterium SS10]
MAEATLTLADEQATAQFGAALATACQGGDIILLDGPLGAGKTTLARAMVQALLGSDENVPSPTFTLVQQYALPKGGELYHYDLYRLEDPSELIELGWEAVGGPDVTALVEWPSRLGAMPPGNVLHLQIAPGSSADQRSVQLHGHGDWGNRIRDLIAGL